MSNQISTHEATPEAILTRRLKLVFQACYASNPNSLGKEDPLHYFSIHPRHQPHKVAGNIVVSEGRDAFTYACGGHISYDIHPAHRGHGYAAEAVNGVIPFIGAMGFRNILLTCNPRNRASFETILNTGAKLVGIFPVPENHYLRHPEYGGVTEIARFVRTIPENLVRPQEDPFDR